MAEMAVLCEKFCNRAILLDGENRESIKALLKEARYCLALKYYRENNLRMAVRCLEPVLRERAKAGADAPGGLEELAAAMGYIQLAAIYGIKMRDKAGALTVLDKGIEYIRDEGLAEMVRKEKNRYEP